MIRINLNPEQVIDYSNIRGIDLYKLKPIPIFLALFVNYFVELGSESWMQERISAVEAEFEELNSELNGLKKTISKYKNIEKQIQQLKAHEETLEQKLVAAKKAISEKKNPMDILIYLSKNTPFDLWFNNLTIENGEISIKGESITYASIKEFEDKIKQSIFFSSPKREVNLQNRLLEDSRRVEVFQIVSKIERFR